MNGSDLRLVYKKEYELIARRIDGHRKGYRQNIALLGRPFIGKSLLISQLLADLPDGLVSVLIDARKLDPSYLVRSFSTSLLSSYHRSGSLLGRPLEELMALSREELPRTVDRVNDLLKEGRKDFDSLFEILETFVAESGRRVVFVVENFEELGRIWGDGTFGRLAQQIVRHTGVMFLITSSSLLTARRILQTELSLLFGNFEEVFLGAIPPHLGREFLSRRLPNLSSLERKFIYRFTGGTPIYIDILSRRIRERLGVGDDSWDAVCEAIFEQVFSQYGLIHQYFMRMITTLTDGPKAPDIPTFLMASTDEEEVDYLAERFGWHRSALDHKVKILQERGILHVDHDKLFFEDKLFRFWLQHAYRIRRDNPNVAPEDYYRWAMGILREMVARFREEESVDEVQKILSLFKSFRDEFIKLPRRGRVRFYAIDRVEVIDDAFPIYCAFTRQGYRWVFSFRRVWDEKSAFEFVDLVKTKTVPPIHRRIVISLEEVPPPVKVVAKEERIWIWDYHLLNHLLKLHRIGEVVW